MAEVVLFRHPDRPLELVFDTDDIASFGSPRDMFPTTCEAEGHPPCEYLHQVLGHAHLHLTFKWGKTPIWRTPEGQPDDG